MEFKGQLKSISCDYFTGHTLITCETETAAAPRLEELQGIPLAITFKKFRKKRSLDANAYYWVLVAKLGDKLNLSKPHLHNILLRRYGQPAIIDGKMIYLVLPDSDQGARAADEAETFHIKPTSEVKTGRDGERFRTYVMLRGSSTYNTEEMAHLIDGLVSECKEVGIETAAPEELSRMLELYEANRKRKGKTE